MSVAIYLMGTNICKKNVGGSYFCNLRLYLLKKILFYTEKSTIFKEKTPYARICSTEHSGSGVLNR